jgi:hypothetical protein
MNTPLEFQAGDAVPAAPAACNALTGDSRKK